MDSLKDNTIYPLIPLRELVTFPSTIIPILVGREKSINALKIAQRKYNKTIFLSVQKNQISDEPGPEEIHEIGVIARVEKSVEQDNGSFRVIIQGLRRGRITEFKNEKDCLYVRVAFLENVFEEGREYFELSRNLINLFEEYINLKRVKLRGIIAKLESNQLSEITDIIISVVSVPIKIKQTILEETSVYKRATKIFNILNKEVYKLKSSGEIGSSGRVESPMDNEIEKYRKKIETASLPDHAKKKAFEELARLEQMPPYSAEGSVSRHYLDWLLSVPWKKLKPENRDISKAENILDQDHYGLEKIKERILDYIAVRQLVNKSDGEIICFVGPPGVGKSSLSKSIARALDREFVRISLGGVKDEAEIRGHRRTYIGSYPGQIVKGLKKAKCMNPVFLLDEIDKLSSDFKGDPSSALLEALDPEQNHEFVDHFLDLELDLSNVFFITTANTIDPVPPALRDRMEIIELSGYTEMEKLNIARNFLLKKQSEKNGLKLGDFVLTDEQLLTIINQYTRESGVRNLERQIGVIARKVARDFVEKNQLHNQREAVALDDSRLHKYLGIPKFKDKKILKRDEVGVTLGLAWTVTGGDILVIESRLIKGKGSLILTGRLGEVMKESSSTAFSYSKIKLHELEFDTEKLAEYDIHLHIPEGAVPKEGPSAGVTLAVSIISLLTGIPVRSNLALTGEITLRGKILPVGGIKEKVLAAHRYGLSDVIIPSGNEKEFKEEIPEDIKKSLKVHLIETMDELLDTVLIKPLKIKNIKSDIIRPLLNSELH